MKGCRCEYFYSRYPIVAPLALPPERATCTRTFASVEFQRRGRTQARQEDQQAEGLMSAAADRLKKIVNKKRGYR